MTITETRFTLICPSGKRTYFFDVKSTRGNDLYLTITESKKRFNNDGKYYFEKHKLFLYKEDFEKFADGLNEVVDKINQLKDSGEYPTLENEQGYDDSQDEMVASDGYSDVSFEDLGN